MLSFNRSIGTNCSAASNDNARTKGLHTDKRINAHTDRHTGTHTERHTDRHTGTHTDRHTGTHTDRHTDIHTGAHTDRHTDRHTDIHTGAHTDRHTGTHADRHAYRHTSHIYDSLDSASEEELSAPSKTTVSSGRFLLTFFSFYKNNFIGTLPIFAPD